MKICGIIGFPIKNPRTLIVWKEYLIKNGLGKKIKLQKYNIENQIFKKKIVRILSNKKLIGLSVTMPYKKKIIKYLDILDKSAENAQSVNLILKKNNQLVGYNTDVLGAENAIKNYIIDYKYIVIIGNGGAGSAILNYFVNKYNDKMFFIISSKANIKPLNNKIKLYKKLNKNILLQKNLIINCTPLGSDLSKEFFDKSPIPEKFFSIMHKNTRIFDIVYSPKVTKLHKVCRNNKIKYISGLSMVKFQAKKGLKLIFN